MEIQKVSFQARSDGPVTLSATLLLNEADMNGDVLTVEALSSAITAFYTTTTTDRTNWGGHTYQWLEPIYNRTAIPYPLGYSQVIAPFIPYEEKKEKEMRGLFEVFVIDPVTDEIVDEVKVIAKNEESAKLKAINSRDYPKDIDEYDLIARKIGDVRPRKTVQEVKVVD